MGRRKVREEKSKLLGTKHTLKLLNRAAHSSVHDTDVSLAGGGAVGYTLFWSSNVFLRDDDYSAPIYVPEDGTISEVYVSLPIEAVSDFQVDVFLNGTTIFSGDKPTVATGDFLSPDEVPTTTALTARDYLEVQILSAGGNYGRAMVYIVVE